MKIIHHITAAILLAASILGAAPASALDKIVIGYTAVGGNAADYIAKDKGFFAKHGLDVDLLLVRGGSVLVPSLVANSIQIGTLATPTMIQAADGGIDLVAVTGLSVFTANLNDSGIVIRTDSTIKTPADLKGKRIATSTIGGVSEIMFDKWLTVKGLDLKSVTMLEVAYSDMPNVIKTGNIDGVLIPDPFMSAIVSAGTGKVMARYIAEVVGSIPSAPSISSIVNSSTRAWVQAHPQELTAFRAAIVEAVAFGKANPKEAIEIVGRTLNLKPEVMATTELAPLSSNVAAADFKWWLDTMIEQDRLRTKLDASKLISP